MVENKMAQVAALFGKKLNEEFEVDWEDVGCYHVMFTDRGLETLDHDQYGGGVVIEALLTGDAEVIE